MKRATQYYRYEGTDIAMIGKAGSSSIGRAVTGLQQPGFAVVSSSGDAAVVERIMNGPGGWQAAARKVALPENPIIPVRDPVERFRSACAQMRRAGDVDVVLDEIAAGGRLAENFHFRPTCDWLPVGEECRLVRFPDDADFIALALGLDELPVVNAGIENHLVKPELTAAQVARVLDIYAADAALYAGIEWPGQGHVEPWVEPAPVVQPVPSAVRGWQAKAAMRMTRYGDDTLYDAVVLALDGMDEGEEKIVVMAAWDGHADFAWGSPVIGMISDILNLEEDVVRGVFLLAESLKI